MYMQKKRVVAYKTNPRPGQAKTIRAHKTTVDLEQIDLLDEKEISGEIN